LPRYVEAELRAFLTCGVFSEGWLLDSSVLDSFELEAPPVEDARLGLATAVFGVRRTDALDCGDDPYADLGDGGTDAAKATSSSPPASGADPGEVTPAIAAVGKPTAVLPTSPKKRGRPFGSKNKKAAPARGRTRS